MKKILIVDSDPGALKMLVLALKVEGYAVVTASTGPEAIRQAVKERPDLIVLDVMIPEMDGYEVSRRIRRMADFAQVPIIFLSAQTQVNDKVRGFHAGANDYITKPASPQELVARIDALLGSYSESVGYIAALFGCKGGVGSTTIAVNLALSLRQQTQASVVLVDGNDEGSDVGIFLNILHSHHTGELMTMIDQLDQEVLRSVLAEHSSGLRVLLGSPSASTAPAISPPDWEKILVGVRQMADFVIFDGPPLRSVSWMPILDLADDVFLITTPDITAMKRLSFAYNLAQSRRHMPVNVYVLLNRYTEQSGFSPGAITRALGAPIHMRIDDVGPVNTYAINRGEPLVLSDKRSSVTRAMSGLAREIVQRYPTLASKEKQKEPLSRLRRLL